MKLDIMDKSKILITGVNGFLGKKVKNSLLLNHRVVGIDKEINICDYYLLEQTILCHAPSIIIHCAGIADPGICGKNKNLAYKVNVIGTSNIVNICKKLNIKLIFMSSDCIFSGKKEEYLELDIPDPINYYGWTKYCGENLVKTLDNYLILRFSWLYGKNSKFLNQILNCNSRIFLDNYQIRYPLLIDDLCYIINNFINNTNKGIYHIRGLNGATKFYFAHLISEKYNLKNSYYFLDKKDISYPRPIVKLNINKLIQLKNIIIHNLEESIQLIKNQSEKNKQ